MSATTEVDYIIVLSNDTDFVFMPPHVKVIFNFTMVPSFDGWRSMGQIFQSEGLFKPPEDVWLADGADNFGSWCWFKRCVFTQTSVLIGRAITNIAFVQNNYWCLGRL